MVQGPDKQEIPGPPILCLILLVHRSITLSPGGPGTYSLKLLFTDSAKKTKIYLRSLILKIKKKTYFVGGVGEGPGPNALALPGQTALSYLPPPPPPP